MVPSNTNQFVRSPNGSLRINARCREFIKKLAIAKNSLKTSSVIEGNFNLEVKRYLQYLDYMASREEYTDYLRCWNDSIQPPLQPDGVKSSNTVTYM